jgi:hypothetical protein
MDLKVAYSEALKIINEQRKELEAVKERLERVNSCTGCKYNGPCNEEPPCEYCKRYCGDEFKPEEE